MRFAVKLFVVLAMLGALGFFAWKHGSAWLKERNKPEFRLAEIQRGTIRVTRQATGEVKPVLSIQIGSFVSGPIEGLFVDFNDEVKKGDLLAKIDPKIYTAAADRDRATLQTRKADVLRVQAELQRARNDEKRALALYAENEDFISQTELDQYRYSRAALEAQLEISKATIEQAAANLKNSEANVEYTEIRSPVDGVVIDKKIEPGQTLAAQFTAPELFVIAPDLREKMHIFASIDEADMALIRESRDTNQPVVFKVEAYPNEVFTGGVIEQIRLSPTTEQNVVTYPVVVATPNPDLKLLPGMTAELTFQVAVHEDILKVPNAAIWYLPDSKEHVHADDHNKLDFSLKMEEAESDRRKSALADKPIDESAEAIRKAATRHVWIRDGEKLRAVEIQVGVRDYQFTEVVGGDLKEGDQVVTGLKPKA